MQLNTRFIKLVITSLLLLSCSVVSAQNVQSYVDSLKIYRQRLDSALVSNDSIRNAVLGDSVKMAEYYNLVSPLTFYRSVAGRQFSVANDETSKLSAVDKAMIEMYIKHPELVSETDRNLNAADKVKVRPSKPVKQDVELTDEAPVVVAPEKVDDNLPKVDLVAARPNFWAFKGDYSLQFLQNYVSSNWYKGGESSYAMIGAITLQANYDNKQKIKWDNKLEMKLGMQSTRGDSIHDYKASEDLIRLTSKLGVQATKKWYYTLQMIAQTQFTHGYKSNDMTVYSDFLSPLNVNLSLGMDYKLSWFNKHLTGTVNISPAALNFKYVDRLNLASRNGIDEGKHSKLDIGSTFTADLVWKFTDAISWKTRLYGFTSYKRTEIEWENTLQFQLSKYISTQVFIYPRFDDSTKTRDEKYGYFQLKEYWSLGFTLSM